jgi:hypothetical protein
VTVTVKQRGVKKVNRQGLVLRRGMLLGNLAMSVLALGVTNIHVLLPSKVS